MKVFKIVAVFILNSLLTANLIAQNSNHHPHSGDMVYSSRLVDFNCSNGQYTNEMLVKDFGNGLFPEKRGFASICDSVYKITFNKGQKVINTGAAVQVNIEPSRKYTLQYRIKYDSNFQSDLHGKQIGFNFGVGYDGGRADDARKNGNGGSVRLQFDSNGDSISNQLYVYYSEMTGQYGNNPGGQHYSMKKGMWNTIRMTITMQSTVTSRDGRIEVWCNGVKRIDVQNLKFSREQPGLKITKLAFESFPGGGGAIPEYDNYLYIDDLTWFQESEDITLNQSNPGGIYKKGENIRATLMVNNPSTDSVLVKIVENFGKPAFQKMVVTTLDTIVIFDKSFNSPSSVIFEAKTQTGFASIGSITEPESFTPGTQRPKDLNAYWRQEIRNLRKVSMDVHRSKIPEFEPGYVCFDIEINCAEFKPVRGYFVKPETSQPKSLPIVIYLHAAGRISDPWVRSDPKTALRYAKMGKGALSFDLNAHGMMNDQANEYYEALEKGELNNYQHIGLDNKSDIYFRGMYLRIVRTIDFLTKQPEWDGKRIMVIGESQGGGQALAAAGLDSRVSCAVATVPAMCDWGGSLVGRKGSWPYPFETSFNKERMLSTLPYFDVAHILKGSKAILAIEIGLIDETCPASAIYTAINQAKGKKIIYVVPYRAHHMKQKAFSELWNKTVNQPKDAFIGGYLK